MAKDREKTFACGACGHRSAQWLGRCPGCGEWNTLEEEERADRGRLAAGRPAAGRSVAVGEARGEGPGRVSTGIREFDRVLGGGLVDGSLVLVGGEPGVGKSTLLLQAAGGVAGRGGTVLYVSGEESVRQVAARADRLGVGGGDLRLLNETAWENVAQEARRLKPALMVIDSIQTMGVREVPSIPGSVSQIREVAYNLMNHAKAQGLTCLVVGHITKDGSIAGPKILEHTVDTVIYFEGDRDGHHRLLRAAKNRFGGAGEVGVFEMTDAGLREVPDPARCFIGDDEGKGVGRSLACVVEGTRVLFLELQALVVENRFGGGRRVAQGFDKNRLELLAAVLEKRLQVPLGFQDIYFNVVGGVRLTGRDVDLAVAAAVLSSFHGKPVPGEDAVFLGEVGLTGEVRSVPRAEARLREMAHLGYGRLVASRGVAKAHAGRFGGVEAVGVADVEEVNGMF